MAAGDRRITGTTSGDVRVTKTGGDTRVISDPVPGGVTGILRNQTDSISRGQSGVTVSQLGGVLVQ